MSMAMIKYKQRIQTRCSILENISKVMMNGFLKVANIQPRQLQKGYVSKLDR